MSTKRTFELTCEAYFAIIQLKMHVFVMKDAVDDNMEDDNLDDDCSDIDGDSFLILGARPASKVQGSIQ